MHFNLKNKKNKNTQNPYFLKKMIFAFLNPITQSQGYDIVPLVSLALAITRSQVEQLTLKYYLDTCT